MPRVEKRLVTICKTETRFSEKRDDAVFRNDFLDNFLVSFLTYHFLSRGCNKELVMFKVVARIDGSRCGSQSDLCLQGYLCCAAISLHAEAGKVYCHLNWANYAMGSFITLKVYLRKFFLTKVFTNCAKKRNQVNDLKRFKLWREDVKSDLLILILKGEAKGCWKVQRYPQHVD